MRNLLVVIDLQKGWWHETATKPAMLRTVKLCNQFQGDIVHCCFRNNPASLFYSQLRWSRFSEETDTDEIPEISSLKLPKYWRSTYSCLTPEVTELVKRYDHVYIAGVFTDISVAATAMGIFDLAIPVSVISDCVGTLHGEEVHQAALKSLESALDSKHVIPSGVVLSQ